MSGGWVLVVAVVAIVVLLGLSLTPSGRERLDRHPRATRAASAIVVGAIVALNNHYFSQHSWPHALWVGLVAGVVYGLVTWFVTDYRRKTT